MKKITVQLFKIMMLLLIQPVFAASPVFTFTPLTSTSIQLRNNETAIVQYTVQNQSRKSHTLVMRPISGINQITSSGNCANPFVLNTNQSCVLTLQINGNQLANNVQGGPIVCQQGANGQPNPLLCYQPSLANSLNITIAPALIFYVGTENGNVYYSSTNGATWTVTASMPAGGSAINSIFVTNNIIYVGAQNGLIYYSSNNGNSWAITTAPDGSAVNSVFFFASVLYASTANGYVYYSLNNGITWQNTTQPDGSAVNAIFVSNNALYAGTANGFVYYSANNGATWLAINDKPDDFAIHNIFLANNTLYVSTTKEYVYTSTTLTGGGSWSRLAQTVFSLFVNASGSTLYAGTQSGRVFSLTAGNELGFVNYSPINTLFVLN